MMRTPSSLAKKAAERFGKKSPETDDDEIDLGEKPEPKKLDDADDMALESIAEEIASGDRGRIKSALADYLEMCRG